MSKKIKEKWTLKRVLKEVVTTLLMLLVITNVLNYIRKPDINTTIYDYKLTDTQENGIDFYNYEDEPLVIHFWGTWCPTCQFEASNINAVSDDYNVISIAVNSGTDDDINAYMNKNALEYRVINDEVGALAKKFNISAYPTTLIYNKKGELKFTEVGYSTTFGLKARLGLLD